MKTRIFIVLLFTLTRFSLWAQIGGDYDPTNPSDPGTPIQKYMLSLVASPSEGGYFNSNSLSLESGSTISLVAYAKTDYVFKNWAIGDSIISTNTSFQFTMPSHNVEIIGRFDYNPDSPLNPHPNYWNKEKGEVIIDDFQPGSLKAAISTIIGDSDPSEVKSIMVIGIMNSNDFGICDIYTSCISLNLSRVSGITQIPSYAFDNTSLEIVYLPLTIEKIGSRAFSECKSLKNIDLPYGLQSIDSYAFDGCVGLTSVDIPYGVTTLSTGVYRGCSGIQIIRIPNSVTSIGKEAFSNCRNLNSITIPGSVSNIKDYAFYNCTNLTSIYSGISNVFSISDNVFGSDTDEPDIYELAKLYVPAGTVDLYKQTWGWKNFQIIVEGSFYVTNSNLNREFNRLHFKVDFSDLPHKYDSLDGLISFSSKDEILELLSYSVSDRSYDLYFQRPKKEGNYSLKIGNLFMNANGNYLDQNHNEIFKEEDDVYQMDYKLGLNELYVIAQSPTTGESGKEGYVDIAFNDNIRYIPLSFVSMRSPTGKIIKIKSVEYLEGLARHRINFETLVEDGFYMITIQKGLKSDSGKEMRYNQQMHLELPCADLNLISVSPKESNLKIGQKIAINYTLRNIGKNNAIGPSVDVLYLSTDAQWTSEAIEIFRDTSTVFVEIGKDYSRTIEIMVPPCTEGHYFLILKTNVAHTFNELSYNDNTLSSDTISLSVDYLTDKNNKFILGRGESRLFKLLVDVDKNIEVIDKNGIANLFSGCGYYPNIDDNPKNGSIAILGSHHFPMTYYLLVSNNEKDQAASQQCELNTREFELDFTGIEKTEIVKYKKAWIPIEMIGCIEMPVFYLEDSHGTKTECLNVYAKTETSFYAQFDTEPLQVGNYGLYVECAGKTGMLQNAVTIKQEVANPKIEAKLILPGTSRIGSTITAYIDYKNVGNVDVPVPLFVITGTEGSEFAVDGYDDFSDECHVYGMNENGVLSALLPGESNRIGVQIKIPNEQIYTADYKLKTITEGCDGMDEHFYLQWLDVDPDENPGCYTDEEWNDYCNRLRRNVGDNWRTFIQAMATVTDLCFTSDFVVHDASYLYDILKGYDLAEIMASLAEEKAKRKNAAEQRFVEPGTIFLYTPNNGSDDPWEALVEWNGKDGWNQTEQCPKDLNTRTDFVFISHGMNNTHDAYWIKNMANELYSSTDYKNIICVDWGRWSYAGGPFPSVSGYYVNPVVERVYNALNVTFNDDRNKPIDISKFYLIGHSHGAHVCGRLTNKYNSQAKRITALDASEELSHPRGSQMDKRWKAGYIDYYKSSVTCGTEYLAGDDNFILASGDAKFTNTGINIFEDIDRHGYAYDWFVQTIEKKAEVGYNWNNKRLEHPKVTNHSGWSGVINGPRMKIENYTDFENKQVLNYTKPWYEDTKKIKQKEWKFRDAFASTMDFHPVEIEDKGSINAGTKVTLRVSISNSADNLSVRLSDRQNETKEKACNVLYISKINDKDPDFTRPQTNNEQAFLYTLKHPLYYLAESDNYIRTNIENNNLASEVIFTFNISKALWEKLKDDDKTAHCYLWVVPGVDKTTADYRRAETYSVPIWKGELRPHDNVECIPIEVKKPDLLCDAGADRTITLQKDQDKVDVNVAGNVVNEGDYELSYAWKEGNSEFSAAMVGTASLGVGTHTLTFEVEASDASFAKARRAPSTSIDTIYDDVVITVKPYTPGDEDDESTETASSWDPNEKIGIRGAGGKSCIRQGETMEYTIFFENDAEKAQLAAQTVTVIDTLDTAFDLATFEFTGAEASNTYIDVPLGKSETTILTDMRPDNDLILKTEMKLDIDKRIVKVVYSSLDTLTYEPTLDVFAGFLPPNDFTHRGEGHFSYRVKLKDDVADGYVVKNQAHIFFDYNDEIATNITHHPVDNSAPLSSVDDLPNETREDSVMVSWSGYDQGAGIRYYDIYRSKNGGNYELWKSHTKDSFAFQHGVKNDIYKYFSIATDSLGFVEEMKTSPEATVKFLGSSDGISSVENDSKIDVIYQNEAFVVTSAEGSIFNVYDLLGQIVMSKQLTSHYERIPFDRKGVYLVIVDNRVGVLFEKKLVTK